MPNFGASMPTARRRRQRVPSFTREGSLTSECNAGNHYMIDGARVVGKSFAMVATVYCRVSTQAQGADGVSIELQRTRAEAFAQANGYELGGVFIEVQSGGRANNRPELQRALAEVCKNRGVLVVYSLSRLARSVKDTITIAERLDRSGANLASLTEKIDTSSAVGRLFFRLMASLADFERDQLSERTESAMAYLRSQNRRISGRVPFGYDLAPDGCSLRPNASEQSVLARMAAWRSAGDSYAAIARRLTEARVPSKTGGAIWSPASTYSILHRAEKIKAA